MEEYVNFVGELLKVTCESFVTVAQLVERQAGSLFFLCLRSSMAGMWTRSHKHRMRAELSRLDSKSSLSHSPMLFGSVGGRLTLAGLATNWPIKDVDRT